MKIKKVKGTQKIVVKREINFEDYKLRLERTQLKSRINHLKKQISCR